MIEPMSKLLTLYGRDATPPPVPVPPRWAYKFDLMNPDLTEPPPELLAGFSRSGPAWMFDAEGHIVMVPENYQAYSGAVASLESNHVTFESTAATSAILRVTDSYPYVFSNAGYRSELIAGKRFFASFTVRAFQAGKVGRIGFYRPTAAATEIQVDLDNGNVVLEDGAPGHILVERIGDLHYRIGMSWVCPDANKGWYAFFGLSGASVGTQFEASDMTVSLNGHCPFVPVVDTTPIKDQPRWNNHHPDGSFAGWKVEPHEGKNMLAWSEKFDEWMAEQVAVSLEADEWAPRRGKAHKVAADGASGTHRLESDSVTVAELADHAVGFLLKKGAVGEWVQIGYEDDIAPHWANLNLSTGEFGNSSGPDVIPSVEEYSKGWLLGKLTDKTAGGATQAAAYVCPVSGDVTDAYPVETCDTEIWLNTAHFGTGDFLPLYIPTAGALGVRAAETLPIDSLLAAGVPFSVVMAWSRNAETGQKEPFAASMGGFARLVLSTYLPADRLDAFVSGGQIGLTTPEVGAGLHIPQAFAARVLSGDNRIAVIGPPKQVHGQNDADAAEYDIDDARVGASLPLDFRQLFLSEKPLEDATLDAELAKLDLRHTVPPSGAVRFTSDKAGDIMFTLRKTGADGYSHNTDNGPASWELVAGSASYGVVIPNDGTEHEFAVWSSDGKPNSTENGTLTYLDCRSNNLSELDVSANTSLTSLNCSSNDLTTFDVSANTSLTSLNCSSNNLSELDVSANTALTTLNSPSNDLTALDVSANTALTILYCSSNNLSELDVSANTALTTVNCSSNTAMTSLSIGAAAFLRTDGYAPLRAYSCALTSIDGGNATFQNTGGGFACDIHDNNLSGPALNKFFTDIDPAPTPTPANHRIDTTDNPGSEEADDSIATDKGYSVTSDARLVHGDMTTQRSFDGEVEVVNEVTMSKDATIREIKVWLEQDSTQVGRQASLVVNGTVKNINIVNQPPGWAKVWTGGIDVKAGDIVELHYTIQDLQRPTEYAILPDGFVEQPRFGTVRSRVLHDDVDIGASDTDAMPISLKLAVTNGI